MVVCFSACSAGLDGGSVGAGGAGSGGELESDDGDGGAGGGSTTAFTIASVTPADGAVGVFLNTGYVAAIFPSDQPMVASSIDSNSFQVVQVDEADPSEGVSLSTAVSGTVSYDDALTLEGTTYNVAIFQPASELTPGTTYQARLTTEVRSMDGEALAEDYVWTFETPWLYRQEWAEDIFLLDIASLPNGGVVVVGYTDPPDAVDEEPWMAVYDNDGSLIAQHVEDFFSAEARASVVDVVGDYIFVAGMAVAGSSQLWIAAYDLETLELHHYTLFDEEQVIITEMAHDSAGNLYIVGTIDTGEEPAFLWKLNPQMDEREILTYVREEGDGFGDYFLDIFIEDDDTITLFGMSQQADNVAHQFIRRVTTSLVLSGEIYSNDVDMGSFNGSFFWKGIVSGDVAYVGGYQMLYDGDRHYPFLAAIDLARGERIDHVNPTVSYSPEFDAGNTASQVSGLAFDAQDRVVALGWRAADVGGMNRELFVARYATEDDGGGLNEELMVIDDGGESKGTARGLGFTFDSEGSIVVIVDFSSGGDEAGLLKVDGNLYPDPTSGMTLVGSD